MSTRDLCEDIRDCRKYTIIKPSLKACHKLSLDWPVSVPSPFPEYHTLLARGSQQAPLEGRGLENLDSVTIVSQETVSSQPELALSGSGVMKFKFQNKSPSLNRIPLHRTFVSMCFILRRETGNGNVNRVTWLSPPPEKPLMSSKRKKLQSTSTSFPSGVLDQTSPLAVNFYPLMWPDDTANLGQSRYRWATWEVHLTVQCIR